MFVIAGTVWCIVTLIGLGYGIISPILERKRINKLYKDF